MIRFARLIFYTYSYSDSIDHFVFEVISIFTGTMITVQYPCDSFLQQDESGDKKFTPHFIEKGD
jgi:hypothetical protein